eukprot:Skav232862  [mRNA]  locus=scaffold2451:162468:166474:+ [translate_table: standard]
MLEDHQHELVAKEESVTQDPSAATAGLEIAVASAALEFGPGPSTSALPMSFKQALLEDVDAELHRTGGAVQYLREKAAELVPFGEWLWSTFPEKDDCLYQRKAGLPACREEEAAQGPPLVVHVAALAFDQTSSLKPPPGISQVLSLIEQYLQDGFVTSAADCGPLLVLERIGGNKQEKPDLWQDRVGLDEPLLPFSLGYLKGFTRAVSLLFLLHRLWKKEIDVADELPRLFETVSRVHCLHVKQESRLEEAMANMRMSCRGSLRKATNLIQAVIMVTNLHAMGAGDHMSFIRKWNSQAARQFQFVGKRNAALDSILLHVSKLGWEECCWTDDNLSTKKLYPKYQFPSRSRKWHFRLKTSDQSMALAVEFIQNKFVNKPKLLRKRMDICDVEEVSMKAAVCVNLADEFCKTVPVDPGKVVQEWCDAWAAGESKIDVELDGLILEKQDGLDVRNIPTFKRLSDQHVFSCPVGKTQHEEATLQWDEFNLMIKQIEYDESVFQNWEKKMMSAEAAREIATFKWKRDRRQQSLNAAELLLDSCCHVLVWDKKNEKNIAEAMNFKRTVIMSKMGLEYSAQIPQIVYMNHTAPCLISSVNSNNAVELLTWALAEQMQSVGVVLCPVFTYQKGRLILEERALLDMLCRGNHNIDWSFAALFSEKCDSRDLRPMCYSGRFVFPSALELSKNCFWTCDLRRFQRTSEIAQLPAREMKEIENLDPDAVPDTTDQSLRIKGANKYAQLGSAACKEIFDSVLRGSSIADVGPGVLLIDLHVGVGDMMQAFCSLRANRPHTFYLGFAEDANEALYVQQLMKEQLADQFSNGHPLPTGEKLPEQMPADLLEGLPGTPRLNVLVIRDNKLGIPAAMVQKWRNHPVCGQQFQKFLDKFLEKHTVIEQSIAQPQAADGSANKRAADPDGPAGGTPKKPRVTLDSNAVVPTDTVDKALLTECRIGNKDSMWVQVRANNCIIFANKGSKDFSANEIPLLGFGKGSFKILKQDAELPDGAVELSFSDSQDLVSFNGVVQTLGDVMKELRKKNPDTKITYFRMTFDGEDPHKFTLVKTHRVIFQPRPEEKAGEMKEINAACREPLKVWETSTMCGVMWYLKSSAVKGLVPVKPGIFLKGSCTIPPAHSLVLTKPTS